MPARSVTSDSVSCLPACPMSRSGRTPVRSPGIVPGSPGLPRSRAVRLAPFPAAVSPDGGPFAAAACRRPSPGVATTCWLHRVESVDGTPWRPRIASPLSTSRSSCLQSVRDLAVGAALLPGARAIPVSGSFSRGRCLPCCTDRSLPCSLPPEGTSVLDDPVTQGNRGSLPTVPAPAVRSPSRRGAFRPFPFPASPVHRVSLRP
jgi:hypothetical protein